MRLNPLELCNAEDFLAVFSLNWGSTFADRR